MATADNNRFLRLWYEVDIDKSYFTATDSLNAFYTGKKWFPYNKGGDLRKWYGNNDYLVNYFNDGKELKDFEKSVIRNPKYYFISSITWSKIGTKKTSFRYKPNGHVFDVAGTSVFVNNEDIQLYILGLLNTIIIEKILTVMSPSLNFEVGQIAQLPILFNKKEVVSAIVNDNILESKQEWDSFEESWDFKKHPLI